MTVNGDLISRGEIFDEADIDAALARFDELHRQTTRMENAASRTINRLFAHDGARDWAAIARHADRRQFRRRSQSHGECRVLDGRDAVIANMQALEEAGEHHVYRHRDPRRAPRAYRYAFPRAAPRALTGRVRL